MLNGMLSTLIYHSAGYWCILLDMSTKITGVAKGMTPSADPFVPETHGTFALVIGIDEYECGEYGNLLAAVADADRFQDYLIEDLQTPREHVISLRNGQATRKAIIDGFKSLIYNAKIVQGMAAMIIYYSGHGAVASKPDEWMDWQTYDNEIEMLCPTDIGILDINDKVIEGIPDRVIGELLVELAIAKGNNIVCRPNLYLLNETRDTYLLSYIYHAVTPASSVVSLVLCRLSSYNLFLLL
ncbi:hypothetical protein EDD18DRAFT_1348755 [Armillaria luteobubalina]|uniref:Peptidase C14 caspase domain-containing protein n=1 Tax=Armillaria luteobubalina TaxID=153913 RepID=A0AA39QDZ5_9AGAR|nr:hypothetical protein EDD18DRAFT_1348755 [Armillaria luteobubalina]